MSAGLPQPQPISRIYEPGAIIGIKIPDRLPQAGFQILETAEIAEMVM